MDFNAIYELVAPYLGVGGTATVITVLLTLVVKVIGFIKEAKNEVVIAKTSVVNMVKNALPSELTISIESMVKTELAKITTGITQAVEEKFLNQLRANTIITEEIAKALCSMKAIPDSVKNEILKLIDIKEPVTSQSLKVELLPIETKAESSTKDVLID